jgi:dienelactone hydrolase
MDADPFFAGEGDIDAARALVKEATDAELFVYPGSEHYFAEHDEHAAAVLMQRVLAFLSTA